MQQGPQLFVITGIMAAGKSTVARALAERFERSVHLRGDTFRRFVVSGRVEMSPDPSPQAWAQLELRYELAVMCADRYVDAGFVTVMQDVILGPVLPRVIDMFRTRPVALIVLAPSPAVVTSRERDRAKVGYRDFTPADLDADLRERTPHIGLWVDNTELSVDETVQYILDNQHDAICSRPSAPNA